VTERIHLGFAITDPKQLDASRTATRYRELSDCETFWEVAVRTEGMAMILMSVVSGKQLPQQIPVVSHGLRKVPPARRGPKMIYLRWDKCFLLTETFDVRPNFLSRD